MRTRDLLKKRIIWKLEKGNHISFWFDNWIENKKLADILDLDHKNISHPKAELSDFIVHKSQCNIPRLNQVLRNHPVI